jgi:hypothetical protein
MFKKFFVGGLALLLVLGLAFSATPAFAQSTAPGATPVPLEPLKLATITNVAMKLTYPPQLVINGTLPSTCQVPVVTRLVGPVGVNGSLPTISIFVKGQPKPDVACILALKSFSTSLTLDATSLKVAPGKYLVLVNPVNGISRFQTSITVH